MEVVRRLARQALPDWISVSDFGIRGVRLAFDLLDPVELLVVVDLAPQGGWPGTLYEIEPDVEDMPARAGACAHGMDLCTVFGHVRAMGAMLPRTRIVGCEPADTSEGMGLSAEVLDAVQPAAELVLELADGETGGESGALQCG